MKAEELTLGDLKRWLECNPGVRIDIRWHFGVYKVGIGYISRWLHRHEGMCLNATLEEALTEHEHRNTYCGREGKDE